MSYADEAIKRCFKDICTNKKTMIYSFLYYLCFMFQVQLKNHILEDDIADSSFLRFSTRRSNFPFLRYFQ